MFGIAGLYLLQGQRDRPRQKVQGIRSLLGPEHPDQWDIGIDLAAQIPHLRYI